MLDNPKGDEKPVQKLLLGVDWIIRFRPIDDDTKFLNPVNDFSIEPGPTGHYLKRGISSGKPTLIKYRANACDRCSR